MKSLLVAKGDKLLPSQVNRYLSVARAASHKTVTPAESVIIVTPEKASHISVN